MHCAGLADQAAEHVRVAAAACNELRWQAPSVVYHFPMGCSAEVSDELQRLGITVTGDLTTLHLCPRMYHLVIEVGIA